MDEMRPSTSSFSVADGNVADRLVCWKGELVPDTTGSVVMIFAATHLQATDLISSIMRPGVDARVEVSRIPEFDNYSDTAIVPQLAMLNSGYNLVCASCGTHVSELTLDGALLCNEVTLCSLECASLIPDSHRVQLMESRRALRELVIENYPHTEILAVFWNESLNAPLCRLAFPHSRNPVDVGFDYEANCPVVYCRDADDFDRWNAYLDRLD